MLEFSSLSKTWVLDVDGTLVKHNGYKIDGYDTLLDGVKEFFENLDKSDKVVLLTARKEEYLQDLKDFPIFGPAYFLPLNFFSIILFLSFETYSD